MADAAAATRAQVPPEADAVFEGGGVKGIAFAGAATVAEKAGVRTWKNVAGTSAGAIVACLLAVVYDGQCLRKILDHVVSSRFADYGPLGKLQSWLWNQFRSRRLAPGVFFTSWLGERIAESPLAKQLGKEELTFADVARDDLPPNLSPRTPRARYRLRVIGSEITMGASSSCLRTSRATSAKRARPRRPTTCRSSRPCA